MDYNKIHKELLAWKSEKIITEEQYETLKKRYAPKLKEVKKIEKRSLKPLIVFSVFVMILGTLSWIGQKNTSLNSIVVPCSLIFLIYSLMYFGRFLEGLDLGVIRFFGKISILCACIITTLTVFYIDIKSGTVFGRNLLGNDWSLFILVSALILMFISYKLESKKILGYSLFSIILWFICEGQIHGGSYTAYWLGLTFPSRMVLFSLIFVFLGLMHNNKIKTLKKLKINIVNYELGKVYYIFGIITMFVPVWIASMGGLLINPMFPIKIEMLLFVLLAMVIAIYFVYLGIINNSRKILTLGLALLILEVYGKLYVFLYSRPTKQILYIMVFVIAFGVAIVVEYIQKYREQLREELLKK